MSRRIVIVAVLAAIPVPAGGASQERRSPTVKELVGNLATASSEEVARQSGDRAAAFLRQEHGPVPEEEIRSLANSLADLVLSLSLTWEAELEEHILHDARATLWSSAVPPGAFMFGVGYATEENGFRGMKGTAAGVAFDALIRIYETEVERALADGGKDAFLEAADAKQRRALKDALYYIFLVDSEGIGESHLLELFANAKPPPPPVEYAGYMYPSGGDNTWCEVGRFLHEFPMDQGPRSRGPDRKRWVRLCVGEPVPRDDTHRVLKRQ